MEKTGPTAPTGKKALVKLRTGNICPKILIAAPRGTLSADPVKTIDDDGDTILIMEGPHKAQISPQKFKVSSKVLSLASPVLKTLIETGNPTSEGLTQIQQAQKSPKQLSIIAESASALEVVLNVVHHKYSKNPETLAVGELHYIANICQAYQLQAPLHASIMHWINMTWPLQDGNSCITVSTRISQKIPKGVVSGHPHMSVDCPKWLKVADVFGLENIMRECGHNLVLHGLGNTGSGGSADAQPAEQRRQIPMHPSQHRSNLSKDSQFVQEIWGERNRILTQLIDGIESKSETFRNAVVADRPVCKATIFENLQKICDIYQVGQIFKLKSKLGLPSLRFQNHTLAEIFEVFKSLEPFDPDNEWFVRAQKGSTRDVRHADCDVSSYFVNIIKGLEEAGFRDLFSNRTLQD
ncbi:hypothetical protein TWF718_009268 [Orbilia javanica]|uniref:BTB domain-containing protein n=1 Tax=Orbilia javanica TaxID=47235 RepID=A0AAN8MZF8_9PEZI